MKYNEHHARHRARAKNTQLNLVKWLNFFPEMRVKDIRPMRQRELIKSLVANGYSANYVKDIFKSGAAAIRWAWRNDMLLSELPIIAPSDELMNHEVRDKRSAETQEVASIARFFDSCTLDHVTRFMMIMIGTGCRPAAAIELRGDCIDLDAGTINLLPKGRRQTNKYRPTVKLPTFIRAIYHKDNICYQSAKSLAKKPTDSLKRAFSNTVSRGGLSEGFVFYSARHTIAKHLRASGVDPWQVSCQLGHSKKGQEITEIYADSDPNYLCESLEAIEQYFEQVLAKSQKLQDFMSTTNYYSLRSRC